MIERLVIYDVKTGETRVEEIEVEDVIEELEPIQPPTIEERLLKLESNVKASQEVQDMMILETDMRMLDIELALMEFAPMKLNLGGSDMLRSATYFNFLKNHIINETYGKEYLENVMNKYLATGRINQDEYNELYKMLYPPVYDIELPIEY